jgi:hypothetical protein
LLTIVDGGKRWNDLENGSRQIRCLECKRIEGKGKHNKKKNSEMY